jgi:hypothetical protein
MADGGGFEGGFEIGVGPDVVALRSLDQRYGMVPGPMGLVLSGDARVLFKAIGRILFWTPLEAISRRPSWEKVCRLSQWRWL